MRFLFLGTAKQKGVCGTHTCRSSFGPPRSNNCDPGPSPDSPKPASTRADSDLFALLPLRVVGIVNRAVSGACQNQPRLTYSIGFHLAPWMKLRRSHGIYCCTLRFMTRTGTSINSAQRTFSEPIPSVTFIRRRIVIIYTDLRYSTTERCRTSISPSWGRRPHNLPAQGTTQRSPFDSTETSGYSIVEKAPSVKSKTARSRWERFPRFLLPIPTVCYRWLAPWARKFSDHKLKEITYLA